MPLNGARVFPRVSVVLFHTGVCGCRGQFSMLIHVAFFVLLGPPVFDENHSH